MASASLGNGGVGSSRSVNGFKSSSSSVDWLGREMLEMRLRDKVDHDEDRVSSSIYIYIYFGGWVGLNLCKFLLRWFCNSTRASCKCSSLTAEILNRISQSLQNVSLLVGDPLCFIHAG